MFGRQMENKENGNAKLLKTGNRKLEKPKTQILKNSFIVQNSWVKRTFKKEKKE